MRKAKNLAKFIAKMLARTDPLVKQNHQNAEIVVMSAEKKYGSLATNHSFRKRFVVHFSAWELMVSCIFAEKT
jgi:hypothetical protein